MKCKKAQKVIVASYPIGLAAKTRSEIDAHLSECPKCARFLANFNAIRNGLQQLEKPSLSEKLVKQTIKLCYEKLVGQKKKSAVVNQEQLETETPIFLWLALMGLLVRTLIWALPVLNDYFKGNIVTKQTIYVAVLIFQNLLVLIYTPILMRIYRFKKQESYYI